MRAAIPNTVRNPTSEPSDSTPSPSYTASTPPTSAIGSSRNVSAARRRLPKAAWSSRKIDDRGGDAEQVQPVLGGVQLRRLAQHLGVDPGGNFTLSSRFSTSSTTDSRSRPSTFAPTSIRRDCCVRSILFGVGARRTSATCSSRTRSPARRVDRELLHVGHAVARRRDAPHVHVVGLAAVEDVADLLAGEQGRGLPADVARLQAVPPRRREVQLDLDAAAGPPRSSDARRSRRRPCRSSPRSPRTCRAGPRGRGRRRAPRSTRSSP